MRNRLLLFTKPWPDKSLPELAAMVRDLGFDGVEIPVRPGYQITPDNVSWKLSEAVSVFRDHGLVIASVAGSLDRGTIDAMGKSEIGLLRLCLGIDMREGYFTSVKRHVSTIIALKDALEENCVKVGIQNHCGHYIQNAIGLAHILSFLPCGSVGAVLDFAHCSVAGEPPAMAYDIIKDSLLMVNFKSAYQAKLNGPDEDEPEWQVLWTTYHNSVYSWKNAVCLLREKGYNGDICLPAEYSRIGDKDQIYGDEAIRRVKWDIEYIKSLMRKD